MKKKTSDEKAASKQEKDGKVQPPVPEPQESTSTAASQPAQPEPATPDFKAGRDL